MNILALCTFIANLFTKSSPEYQYANSYLTYEEILGTYPIRYCFYLVLFLPFYYLSITAITFTVSKPLSHVSILSAIPRILKRLGITFLHALPQIFMNYMAYCAVFTLIWTTLTLIRTIPKIDYVLVTVIGTVFFIIYVFLVFVVHGNFIVWWNFANMLSVLEPEVYGPTAIKKITQILQTKRIGTGWLVFYFVVAYEVTLGANLVMQSDKDIIYRVLISSLWVLVLAVLNFLGLAVQNLVYYHAIDEGVLSVSTSERKESGNDNLV